MIRLLYFSFLFYLIWCYTPKKRKRIKPKTAHKKPATYNQIEKQRLQQEKQLQKEQIAENDLQFYINRVNQLYNLIWDLDFDIEQIEKQIEIDNRLRKVDSIARREKQKEKLIRKRLSIENQIHVTENRINKAKYILHRVA